MAKTEGEPEDVSPAEDPSEIATCTPAPLLLGGFNPAAAIPYGCTSEYIRATMQEFIGFLGYINVQLHARGIMRFESMLSAANFSSMVGEFAVTTLPKHCPSPTKNRHHNGHPDLLPPGAFAGDAAQHGAEGIEVKGSRYFRGWQGLNPEECWLLVFVFAAGRPNDVAKKIPPAPFSFRKVYLGRLVSRDWAFSGREGRSRRTITASVTRSGFEKMRDNWIYDADIDAVTPPPRRRRRGPSAPE